MCELDYVFCVFVCVSLAPLQSNNNSFDTHQQKRWASFTRRFFRSSGRRQEGQHADVLSAQMSRVRA